MPTIIPTSSPEGVEGLRRGREKGPPTEAGGWCYTQGTASGENATNGGLREMGAGCMLTHAPTQMAMRSSTVGRSESAIPDRIGSVGRVVPDLVFWRLASCTCGCTKVTKISIKRQA